MYECACKRGECDKVTGECICPDGWYGLECQDGESSRTVTRKKCGRNGTIKETNTV